jgi:hypothetical protein
MSTTRYISKISTWLIKIKDKDKNEKASNIFADRSVQFSSEQVRCDPFFGLFPKF